MPSPEKMSENQSSSASHQFDRSTFHEKMSSFERDVRCRDGAVTDDDVDDDVDDVADDMLTLDDTILTDSDEEGTLTKRAHRRLAAKQRHDGALEQTLMMSPSMRKVKKPTTTPKSARKGLARFIRSENEDSERHRQADQDLPGLEPIWHYSDIMSVGASVAAETMATMATTGTRRSVKTYHPGTSNKYQGGTSDSQNARPTCDDLWSRATKSIAVGKDFVKPSSSVCTSFAHRSVQSEHRPLRSESVSNLNVSDHLSHADHSLLRKSPKGPKRKTKNESGAERLSQSEQLHTMGIQPSPKDTTARVVLPRTDDTKMQSKAAPENNLGTSSRTEHSARKKKSRNKERSHSIGPGPEREGGQRCSKSKERKPRRSKSLSRVNLYEHESVGSTKRDPSKRRASRREKRGPDSARGASPRRNAMTSPDGKKLRLSRRQLLKRMDSPMSYQHNNDGDVIIRRSLSPRPGCSTTKLLRRGDSRRNLHTQGKCGSNRESIEYFPRDMVEYSSTSCPRTGINKLPRRGDSKRNITNSGTPKSAPARRKLSTQTVLSKRGPEDKRKLLKRIESVNSFFGQGLGEIGSSYPSASHHNSVVVEKDTRAEGDMLDIREANESDSGKQRKSKKKAIMTKVKSLRNLGSSKK